METNYIPLESIQIATPCRADWNKMTGDEQSRFCSSCAKNVYNFSAMTRAEAERLILEKEGHLCVRLHRRADGTVITSDCAVGISPIRRSAGALRAMMAAAVAAILGVFGVQSSDAAQRGRIAPQRYMVGEVVAAPTLGIPTPKVGKQAVKPVKMPSKAKAYGKRAPRKSAKSHVQHR